MTKSQRQSLVLELIATQEIDTQETLVQALKARGVEVTQATISRDIKELRLAKAKAAGGGCRYVASPGDEFGFSDRLRRMLRESMLSVACSENLVVVRTLSGSANVAAEALDSLDWPEVLGTLAGDNTVLVVAQSKAQAPEIIRRLEEFMH
jgi:transcriptional regulator of arginine metabolism